jgi:hypothetical protein
MRALTRPLSAPGLDRFAGKLGVDLGNDGRVGAKRRQRHCSGESDAGGEARERAEGIVMRHDSAP